MRVYVVYGFVQWSDFEWIEGIHRTLKGARGHRKALEKQAVDDDRKDYFYRFTGYAVQD